MVSFRRSLSSFAPSSTMGVSSHRNGVRTQMRPTASRIGVAGHVLRAARARSSAPVTSKGFSARSAAHSGIRLVPGTPRDRPSMMSTLSSDSSDLVSLFSDEHTSRLPARFDSAPTSRSEVRSPSSTELSDDSSLTNDDLVVLSDLFGFTNSGSAAATQKPNRARPARPRSRKRPRPTTMALDDGTVLPKSQQQRQKLEIECLKKQVVELQATIENLQARKLERERQAVERDSSDESYDNSSTPNEWGINRYQIAAAQKLAEQNEKLRSQVAAHLGQLQQLEQLARTRYLANAFSEQAQLNEHSTSTYYSESC